MQNKTLNILLMDDDPDVLEQLRSLLPSERRGYTLIWEPCDDFEKAFRLISSRRFDLVVTDIYRDQTDHGKPKNLEPGNAKGLFNVEAIRQTRFCPVVAFSDGSIPLGFTEGPFTKFADKSAGNKDILAKLDLLLDTGIPQIAQRLHNELDGVGAEYLWTFLERNWDHLKTNGLANPIVAERLIRRRAATQLGRLNPDSSVELGDVEGVEFYICPKISNREYRLGEILKHIDTGSFRIILTPHCHLTVQTGDTKPKADMVLTIKTYPASEIINQKKWPKEPAEKLEQLRRRIKTTPEIGKPEGRYWFLPQFNTMPDLYCDFMSLESLPYKELIEKYEPFSVLDTPFAEALQASFTRFYSAVGVGNLRPERFTHLIPKS